MLTLNKLKKVFLGVFLILAFSASPAKACNPVNPVCLFKMLLKATPGLPTFDFVSLPAAIPHYPAALQKEFQQKLKQDGDDQMNDAHSEGDPSAVNIPYKGPDYSGAIPAEGEEYMALEAFKVDSDDPMEIAKAIEPIFVRPGWNDKNSEFTRYDKALLAYYKGQFRFNNSIEVLGFIAYMQNKLEEMLSAADEIQQMVENSQDINQSLRANFAARLMEYELRIIENHIRAAEIQVNISDELKKIVLAQPVLSGI